MLSRTQIAMRIARELQDGFYVNLGIGIPTLVANYIPDHINVMFQSENGLLGMGPFPTRDHVDPDLINAGKQTVTAIEGASFFSSADSFAMICGGHIDLTVLGAFEVDVLGNIASWMIPKKRVKGMGGAMDLVASGSPIIVAMNHADKQGNSKLLPRCTLPLTGVGCITRLVTDLSVLTVKNKAFHLEERAPGVSVDFIRERTAGDLIIEGDIPEMVL